MQTKRQPIFELVPSGFHGQSHSDGNPAKAMALRYPPNVQFKTSVGMDGVFNLEFISLALLQAQKNYLNEFCIIFFCRDFVESPFPIEHIPCFCALFSCFLSLQFSLESEVAAFLPKWGEREANNQGKWEVCKVATQPSRALKQSQMCCGWCSHY